MTVLVVAPHPDDECLGCGGTVLALADRGTRVVAVFLTSGELGLGRADVATARALREAEAEEAAGLLGLARTHFLRQPDWGLEERVDHLARRLRDLLEEESVAHVYAPHAFDDHPDHAAAARAVNAAVAAVGADAPPVSMYEVWTPMRRWARAEDITATMGRKLAALRAHASQLDHFDYCAAVEGLNRYRGALTTRTAYAEVFGDPHDD